MSLRLVAFPDRRRVDLGQRRAGQRTLDRAAARREILRRGQRQAGLLAQAHDAFDDAFAERRTSDHHRPPAISQSGDQYFRGARRAAVHKHRDPRASGEFAAACHPDTVGFGRSAATCRGHCQSLAAVRPVRRVFHIRTIS